MSTIHNQANKNDISNLVLLAGDPLRAKYFAETYLEGCKLVNSVRNMLAYTGMYKGKKITIMGHGMGVGSIGIYSYELFDKNIYDVDIIIRLGSCGCLVDKYDIKDVVVVEENYSDTAYGKYFGFTDSIIKTDPKLMELVEKAAQKISIPYKKTKTFTAVSFYSNKNLNELSQETKCETIEMEAFVLSVNAWYCNKKAITILTVADVNDKNKIVENKLNDCEELSFQKREKDLNNMFKLGAQILLDF